MGRDQSFSEQVASKLIEQIKAGTAPWQRPYEAGMGIMPFNPVTGTRYKGINLVNLMAQEYGDPRWMTYKQAKEEGYQVRRGERATVIQYWKFEERTQRKDEQGKAVRDQAGNPVYESRRLERPQVFLAYVFNAKQIDGIPAVERKVHNWDPVEEAERILRTPTPRFSTTVQHPSIGPGAIRSTFRCETHFHRRQITTQPLCTNSAIGRGTRHASTGTFSINLDPRLTRVKSSGRKSPA
jgi:antirestriction protein ArdC